MKKIFLFTLGFFLAAIGSRAQTLAPGLSQIINQFAEPTNSSTGLLARYLVTEGTGTTLNDSSGNNYNASFASLTSKPAWANTGLNWTAGTTQPIPLPTNVTGVHTFEILVNNTTLTYVNGSDDPTNPAFNTPFGYATGNGVNMHLSPNYDNINVGDQGYATIWPAFNQNGNGAVSFGPVIDNGVHDFILVMDSSKPAITLYVDGQQSILASNSPPMIQAIVTAGIQWEIGGSVNGSAACPIKACGFSGEILGVSASSTTESAQQALQDHNAWRALAFYKGTQSSPSYGPTDVQAELASIGESIDFGHGLSSPATGNFTYQAASILTSSYSSTKFPLTFLGIADGADSNTGFNTAALECMPKYEAMAANVTGPKFAIFHPHGNTEAVINGELVGGGNVWPDPPTSQAGRIPPMGTGFAPTATLVAQALADLDGFAKCAATIKQYGWYSIFATAIQSDKATDNQNSNDIRNPLVRKLSPTYFSALWDPNNDSRFGTDGAGGLQLTNCNTVKTYQSDGIHPTGCGQLILANQLAAVVADLLQRSAPETAVIAATFTMGLQDIDGTLFSPGGGTTTILPCGGLSNKTLIAKIQNTGSSTETIQASTEYQAGAQDTIQSDVNSSKANTFSLLPGSIRRFEVAYDGVPGDSCYITASS